MDFMTIMAAGEPIASKDFQAVLEAMTAQVSVSTVVTERTASSFSWMRSTFSGTPWKAKTFPFQKWPVFVKCEKIAG